MEPTKKMREAQAARARREQEQRERSAREAAARAQAEYDRLHPPPPPACHVCGRVEEVNAFKVDLCDKCRRPCCDEHGDWYHRKVGHNPQPRFGMAGEHSPPEGPIYASSWFCDDHKPSWLGGWKRGYKERYSW